MESNGRQDHSPHRDVKPGDVVRIETDHPTSNGQFGTVVRTEEWGVHLETRFGSGRYRAAWGEFLPVPNTELLDPDDPQPAPPTRKVVPRPTPTGDPCPTCGSVNLVRTGSCVTCQDCGHNEGCG